MPVNVIQHREREVIVIDYSHCKLPKETIDVIDESEQFLMAYEGLALVLVDVTGAPGSSEYMARVKEVGQKTGHKVERRAIVGVMGLKKILFQGFSRIVKGNNRLFDTREEAIDFLVSA